MLQSCHVEKVVELALDDARGGRSIGVFRKEQVVLSGRCRIPGFYSLIDRDSADIVVEVRSGLALPYVEQQGRGSPR